MTPAEKKASELWAQREHLKYPPATLDEIAEDEFKAGFLAALELAEVRGLEECAEFYSKRENLGKTVWEDDGRRDGRCWLEDFDSYEIAEVYGPTSTGDYGIKANDALEAWRSFRGEK